MHSLDLVLTLFFRFFLSFFFSFVLAVLAGLPIGREQPFSHDCEKQFDEFWISRAGDDF